VSQACQFADSLISSVGAAPSADRIGGACSASASAGHVPGACEATYLPRPPQSADPGANRSAGPGAASASTQARIPHARAASPPPAAAGVPPVSGVPGHVPGPLPMYGAKDHSGTSKGIPVPNFPRTQQLPAWKVAMVRNRVAASPYADQAEVKWFKEIEDMSFEALGKSPAARFQLLDSQLAAALIKILPEQLRTRV